jgi:peptidoglycan/LPS O-acetylase OafA/YrhL
VQTYRPDIDGLRAVAVLSVLAYHAFPDLLPGGFVGVDVFFVISGYLITGIIRGEIAQQRFSVLEFYKRRARRLFPALVVVLLACLALGWHVLLARELEQLGKHVVAGAAFASNLALWSEAGYFDTRAESKILLHLWSLGVEEQFYLVWPAVAILAARRGSGWLAGVVLASFAANLALVEGGGSAAFFLPLSRVWELGLGGLLAWHGVSLPARDRMSVLALAIVVAATVLLIPGMPYPGWPALLPVTGALLLIAAGPGAVVNRALGHPALVWIGLISYPLYLWHWPVLVYARLLFGQLGAPELLLALGLSVVLAWLTYRFVEQPVRRISAGPALATLALAGVAVLGIAVNRADGLPSRPIAAATAPLNAALGDVGFKPSRFVGGKIVDATTYAGTGEGEAVIIGDSHMAMYQARVRHLYASDVRPGLTTIYLARDHCAPLPGSGVQSIDAGALAAIECDAVLAEARVWPINPR